MDIFCDYVLPFFGGLCFGYFGLSLIQIVLSKKS